jgi:CHAT domain-containing protein
VGRSEQLTVRDLLAGTGFELDLVVMSACQSAITGALLPDEAISLPTALLQVGARTAVGSQWAVPDAPTALLMARFYEFWQLEGHDPPEALRRAQLWLRDATNAQIAEHFPSLDVRRNRVLPSEVADWGKRRAYAHPDCWGGFVFHGAWSSGASSE